VSGKGVGKKFNTKYKKGGKVVGGHKKKRGRSSAKEKGGRTGGAKEQWDFDEGQGRK